MKPLIAFLRTYWIALLLALVVILIVGIAIVWHLALGGIAQSRTITEISFPHADSKLEVRYVEPGALGADVLVVLFTDQKGLETVLRKYPGDTHFRGFVAVDSTRLLLILIQGDKQFQDTLALPGMTFFSD